MFRKSLGFACVLSLTLYIFVGLTQIPTLALMTQGRLPLFETFVLLLKTPLLMIHFGEPLPTTLFFLSVFLSGLYLFLFFERIARTRTIRLKYGLSGSLLSIMSIGCVACGALLSPLAIATSLGVPLALIGHTEILLGIGANILLTLGVILLVKDRAS